MASGLISISNQVYAFTSPGRRRGDPRPPTGDREFPPPGMANKKVDENSTAISVTNDTTETTIATLTLPALTLSSTGAARLSATGTLDKNTAGTYTMRVKLADQSSTDTVLETTAFTPASSTDEHPWAMEAWFLGKQPNVNRSWGVMDVGGAAASGILAPTTYSVVGWSTSGLDESEEWTVSITVQMSAASTALSASRQVAILEAVN